MKALIIDCDGVLYPGNKFSLSKEVKAIEEIAYSRNISKEQYNKISKETIERGEEGLYNFVLNLVNKNMDSFYDFCKKLTDSLDYSKIERDDELFQLLTKASKKYEICILTNDNKYHLDKVYKQLFGKTLEEFPFKSYDISSTLKEGCFHPKQSKEGFINFMNKINK